VIGDLTFLGKTGLDSKIMDLAKNHRTEIIGVCGGFQMLGQKIADPHHVESGGQTLPALGLIPVSTVLSPQKTLTRITAKHSESGLALTGYEIHHGLTSTDGANAVVERQDGQVIGTGTPDGLVWGTYLHGIFDADEYRRWFIDRLRMRRGLPAIGQVCAVYDLEPAFDRLADVVRESIDLSSIYRIMGLR